MDIAVSPKTFWQMLGMRAIGAAVVTARGTSGPAGFLALSATHLTASPATMLVSIGATTSALSAIRESGAFAINYLSKESEDLAHEFGGRGKLSGAERFTLSDWTALSTGSPILAGAVGSIDCRVEEIIVRHETAIALGTVVAWVAGDCVSPLISFSGSYL